MSEENKKDAKPPGMKRFTIIWLGQVVSLMGSGLTSFALGIWVLQHTESVTRFTLITVIAGLPGLALSPLAGALVDRWSRKAVLIASDCGSAVLTLIIAYLLYNDALEVWHIYAVAAMGAVFAAFQWPAFVAAITLIVKPKQYGRVNGMLQFGQAGTTIAAPGLAGFLMLTFDIWMVLIIDFATFLFAVGALSLVKIPTPPRSEEAKRAKGSIWKEAAFGWTFIKERPGLLGLLLFFASVNFIHSMCGIAVVPLALRLAGDTGGSTAAAGTVAAFVGVGLLIGSLYMSITGGPKKKTHGVFGLGLVSGILILVAGATPSLFIVTGAVMLWHAALPIANGCSQAIWQVKTPPDVQGRVFAVRRLIAQFTVPLGDFSAGPLSDYVFEPLMAKDGALAGVLGPIIGTGPGRGIGLMMLTFGLFPVLFAIFAYLKPHVRNLEEELPDAVRDDDEDEKSDKKDAAEGEKPNADDADQGNNDDNNNDDDGDAGGGDEAREDSAGSAST